MPQIDMRLQLSQGLANVAIVVVRKVWWSEKHNALVVRVVPDRYADAPEPGDFDSSIWAQMEDYDFVSRL